MLNRTGLLLIVALFATHAGFADTGYQGVLLNPVKSISSHSLIDHHGNPVRFPSTGGNYQLAFFGYVSCPDVCPMSLHKIRNVIGALKQTDKLDIYFITIDGDRDKPEQIKAFLDYYHPDITGLTGNIRTIKQVEKEFGILTRKFQGKSALAYKLEHSVFMYLLNPNGELMLMYPASSTSQQIVSDLNRLLAVPLAHNTTATGLTDADTDQ